VSSEVKNKFLCDTEVAAFLLEEILKLLPNPLCARLSCERINEITLPNH
jgi:hypothetical protein